MNIRLQQFLAAENISQAQFADTIGVARASVSHILAGRNKPGYDFITGMIAHYPALNVDWLLTGKGKMYKSKHDDDDLLFRDDPAMAPIIPASMTITRMEKIEDNPTPVQEDVPNTLLSSETNYKDNPKQDLVNQRKAVKIIILYDDGSFQEISK